MSIQNTRVPYYAYLLRLWHRADGPRRVSLESVQNGERHDFATLEQLLIFLAAQEEAAPHDPDER